MFTMQCADCEDEVHSATKPRTPFCGALCKERSSVVRYRRSLLRRLAEEPGFEITEDHEYALKIRMAFVLSGGYDAGTRKPSPDVRALVVKRDKGKCVKCGAPGQEVDHINGPRPDLDNLQLLCIPCHHEKTNEHLQPITPNHPEYDRLQKMVGEIEARVHSPAPLKACDSPEWPSIWRTEMAKRVAPA